MYPSNEMVTFTVIWPFGYNGKGDFVLHVILYKFHVFIPAVVMFYVMILPLKI